MSKCSGGASFPHSHCLDIKILYSREEQKRGATQAGREDTGKHRAFCRESDHNSKELATF